MRTTEYFSRASSLFTALTMNDISLMGTQGFSALPPQIFWEKTQYYFRILSKLLIFAIPMILQRRINIDDNQF